MNTQVNFNQAYLKSINLIKEDDDAEETETLSGVAAECGDTENECKGTESECNGKDCDKDNSKEVIHEEDDEEKAEEDEIDLDEADNSEDSDEQKKDQDDEGQDQEQDQEEGTCFCFKTSNKTLIDAINSGFDKVTFTVKAKDDEGNDTTTDVEFTADDFADFEECDCDECDDSDEEDTSDDTEDDDLDELLGDDDQGDEEFGDDEESNSFESVFQRYYGSVVKESAKPRKAHKRVIKEHARRPRRKGLISEGKCSELRKLHCITVGQAKAQLAKLDSSTPLKALCLEQDGEIWDKGVIMGFEDWSDDYAVIDRDGAGKALTAGELLNKLQDIPDNRFFACLAFATYAHTPDYVKEIQQDGTVVVDMAWFSYNGEEGAPCRLDK